jgi:hypothetical protein
MLKPNGIPTATILLAHACALLASSPSDTTPSHSFVYVEHDIPGIYHGELRAADLNGDNKPDLVLYGVIDNGAVCHNIWDFSARVVDRIGSQIW